MIAYFASDLIWSTRIRTACDAAGLESRPLGSAPLSIVPDGAIIDLDDPDRALGHISALRQRFPDLRILAFGPHVDRVTLEKAQDLGADRVLPRGAFAQQLEPLVRWVAGAEDAGEP